MAEDTTRVGRGISGGPLRELKAIQSLLKDVYSDPRTIIRELVQNADDAEATHVEFVLLEQGMPDAANSLLRGPALLVANNGPFSNADADALHQAVGGSKEDDASKVGTFGLGLKSVFHICEAFAYVGAIDSSRTEGVLNPWIGTGDSDGDPIHPDWDGLDGRDRGRLNSTAEELLDGLHDGLLLWLPLRCAEHLDRGEREGGLYGIKTDRIAPSNFHPWFSGGQTESLALSLVQCGHLLRIAATKASHFDQIRHREPIACVYRPADAKWVGRYRSDDRHEVRPFAGTVYADDSQWHVTGAEAVGSAQLRRERAREDWPTVPVWRDGRHRRVPQKGLAHAALTVLHPVAEAPARLGLRLRWAAYLPLTDESNPTKSAIDARIAERFGDPPAWQIVLHGYFWPSQDRKSIPGVTDVMDENEGSPSDVRTAWNAAMRDELLLPLLPSVLERVVAKEDQNVASNLLRQVGSGIVGDHLDAVCRRDLLLPRATVDGVSWVCRNPSHGERVLSVPRWTKAPQEVRRALAATWQSISDGFLVIDEHSPRLATGDAVPWPVRNLERLLRGVSDDVFQSASSLNWIAELIRHTLAGDAETDGRAMLVADWLGTKVGEGALRGAIGAPTEDREGLREAWRQFSQALPPNWLVPIDAEALQGVSALAREGVFGNGLFPGLFQEENQTQSAPDPGRLDRALQAVGKQLTDQDLSGNAKHTRLRLAEALFAVRRADRSLGDLESLPLIRAARLPGDVETPLSVAELHRQVRLGRAFAGADVPTVPDPKSAVGDLADALGECAWFVGRQPPGAEHLPPPTNAELAKVIVRAPSFAPPLKRKAVLQRIAQQPEEQYVSKAIRTLLAGRAAEADLRMFFGQSTAEGRTLDILLRLSRGSSAGIPEELVALVQQWNPEVREALSISPASTRAFHDLCGASRDATMWAELDDNDALHLLQSLYGPTYEDQQRWYDLPLHRGRDGPRAAVVDGQTYRTVPATELPAIPQALKSRLRILAPESAVEHLYDSIPELTTSNVLRLMLEDGAPEQFADDIIKALRRGGDVDLPQDQDLRDALRRRMWLPCKGGGCAPDNLIVAPDAVLSVLRELGEAGALGGRRLPADIDSDFWSRGEAIVRRIHGGISRIRQLERVERALTPQEAVRAADGAYAIVHDAATVDADFVTDAMATALVREHRGWELIATFHDVLRGQAQDDHDTTKLLVAVAKQLCGQVEVGRQIAMLQAVSGERPPKDSAGGRTFAKLLRGFATESGFSRGVLPRIDLPTQDGNWHPASTVAKSASGVARRHLVLAELREPLALDEATAIPPGTSVRDQRPSSASVDTLREYFEPWRNRVRPSAVGSFLALLGPGLSPKGSAEKLAKEWLGGVSLAVQRHRMFGSEGDNPAATVSVYVSPDVTDGATVSAVSVLGDSVEMEAAASETLFAVDPVLWEPTRFSGLSPHNKWWEVRLRDSRPGQRSAKELLDLLGSTVDQWAVKHLGGDRQKVREGSAEWRSSTTDIAPARAAILATLPLTLRQIDVNDHEVLQGKLKEAEVAQYELRQMGWSDASEAARKREQKALDELAKQIEAPEHHGFLWHRIQRKMHSNGYSEASVLLELAQNADDALAQAAELKGGDLPPNACRLVIEVRQEGDTHIIDVTHHGRPINETGGSAFPAGKERQWDQDLYFMMLMNLSGKPGESLGQSGTYATTGRFGLGFKSVHLLSQHPSVVSGFMSFSIAGGLLPQEAPKDDVPSEGGQLGTRVRLPLRSDEEPVRLLERAFGRFDHARPLLSVFAREIREVIVQGGPTPGRHAFDGRPIDGAPGWSIGATTALPTEDGRWRVLRFKPSEAGQPHLGTLALAVGIREGVPTRFSQGMPFLWNVVPTGEGWGCGYAINGPFKLDPGRTHVSLDDEATLRAATALGESLAHGLVRLHDAGGPPDVADDFVTSLWRVLAAGLDTEDAKRRRFLRELHSYGRGLSGWVRARSVVPTGLPAPFHRQLPQLTPNVRVEVAQDFDQRWCRALSEMAQQDEDLANLFRNHHAVSDEVAKLLQPLLDQTGYNTPKLLPHQLVAELAKAWNHRLTPERLRTLRPIGREDLLRSHDAADWHRNVVARSAAGEYRPLRQLLLPNDLGRPMAEGSDTEVADEVLRSAFAPECWRLDSSYIRTDDDLKVFRWLRGAHHADAAAMAEWIRDLPSNRRPAALLYLMDGLLAPKVLANIHGIPQRPTWLAEYDSVVVLLEGLGKESWERNRLLSTLFPDRFKPKGTDVEPLPSDEGADADAFFRRLADWWADDRKRQEVIDRHEEECWPSWLRNDLALALQSNSSEHWLALLILGACQSFGRTQDVQHRGFLDLAHQRGWWSVFLQPANDEAWMDVLRGWQDEAMDRLDYRLWLSLFPTIYQLSRHLNKYQTLITSSARRPERLYSAQRVLAPRADDALSGAGASFDAPPMPLGLGFHWCLRELVRLRVLDPSSHLAKDCYVPARRVLGLLRPLGLSIENNSSASAKSQAIHEFLQKDGRLDAIRPHLFLSFDIPLRHIAKRENEDLRREWGLAQGEYNTLKGDWVESKSEMVIANLLFEQGVEYEHATRLSAPDGSSKDPDFTIHGDREDWYWEHWGMMDDPKYVADRDEKVDWYNKHFRGRLEQTFETGNLTMEAKAIIRHRVGTRG